MFAVLFWGLLSLACIAKLVDVLNARNNKDE